MVKLAMENKDVVNAIAALTREVKNISKSLEVIAQDIKKKNEIANNTIIKG